MNFKMGLAATYNKTGRTYLEMKEIKKALHYFEKSHDIAKAIGIKPLVAFTAKNIGKTHGRAGR
ncbi:MAG: tetratricopeptide repeat protein [Desulfatiglandales bacterium]|jgi:hypothetical protein|nr:tetratricopeptide repeat protein [Desulfatiglandales bacterium]